MWLPDVLIKYIRPKLHAAPIKNTGRSMAHIVTNLDCASVMSDL